MLKFALHKLFKSELAVKINAAFCRKFIIKKDDVELVDYKHFVTKNLTLYRGDNIKHWFEKNLRVQF